MKHTVYECAILSLITITFFIVPMDKPLPTMIVKEITAVKNPCKVAFAANGELIIGGDGKTQDDSGVYLANWKENKTIRTIFKGIFLDPYCFPNQQRNAMIVNPVFQVAVYDLAGTKTYALNREFCISTCTANGTVYAVECNGTTHNNKNDKTFTLPTAEPNITFHPLTAHNTKERIFFTDWLSERQSSLYTVDIENNNTIDIKSQNMPIVSNHYPNGDVPMPVHSPISDTMAIFWPFGDKWSLYDPEKNEYLIENINNGACRLLAFHPQKSHLLALLTKNGFVKLYNTNTETVIASTENSLGKTTQCDSFNKQMMDFSADGKYLAVTFDNKCFVLSNFDQYID